VEIAQRLKGFVTGRKTLAEGEGEPVVVGDEATEGSYADERRTIQTESGEV
jgi:hypothetical protein